MNVYAYVRFSSDRQRDGDSIRRQREGIAAYCLAHGLTVTEEIKDEGKSAFHGANRKRGEFSTFLGRVMAGEIEAGSILIIESVDRLSREEVMTALDTYTSLINAGLTIVTTMDGQSFNRANYNSQWTNLILTLSKMAVANEESEKKSTRSKGAWEARRLAGTNIGSCQPGWLTKDLQPIDKRVAIIERIFREVAEHGHGTAKVAARLNADIIPIFTKGRKDATGVATKGSWHNGAVRALIRGRAVLGEFQPMKWDDNHERVAAGPVIPDYYPKVISADLYHRAQAVLNSRGFKGGQGRKGDTFANLFGQIANCQTCGASLRQRTGGKYRYLVCSGYARSVCSASRAIRYETFETEFLDMIQEVRFTSGKADDTVAMAAVAEAEHRRGSLQTQIENFVAMIANGTVSAALGLALQKAEADAVTMDREIIGLKVVLDKIRATPAPNASQTALAQMHDAMRRPNADLYAIRSKMALAIRQIVNTMVMDPAGIVHVTLVDHPAVYEVRPNRAFSRDDGRVRLEGERGKGWADLEAFQKRRQAA